MLGYSADELSKMKFRDITPAEDLDKSLSLFGNLISGADTHVDFEKRNIRKDGSICWVEICTSLLKNSQGEGEVTLSVVHDVTERKRTADALQSAQFSHDHSGDAVSWIGESGKLDYANQSCQTMFGYTQGELLAKHIWDLDPDVAEADWPHIWAKLTRRDSHTFESVFLVKGGGRIMVEVTTTLVSLAERQFVCSFSRDITELKHGEAALRESEARYREIFDDAPAALWVEDWSPVKKMVDRLRQEGVKDWRAYFAGNRTHAIEAYDLAEILQISKASLDLFGATNTRDFIERFRGASMLPEELKLKQILINILSNAIDFTPKGGTITTKVEQSIDGGLSI